MKGSVWAVVVFVSSLFALRGVQAQSPDVEWAKTLQGFGAWSVQQTADDGYIVTGDVYRPSGKMALHLIRTNQTGDTLWTCMIGSDVYAGGRSGRECSDGSFIAAGHISLDVCVAKTTSGGVPLWTKTFIGYIPGYINRSSCVRETTDGGYVICGYSGVWGVGSQALIIKLDEDGNQEFLYTYGGTQYESANAIIQTPDTGYLAVGSVRPVSTTEWYDQYWILKINAEGGQEWFKVYGGSNADIATAVCPAGDGGYLVAGYTDSFNGSGNYDFYLMKIDSSGDSLWAKTYGLATRRERCYSMTQMEDDSFILAGARTGDAYNGKVLAVGVNANGDELWTKEIPDVPAIVADGYAVDATEDGGCIMAGAVQPDNKTYLVKLAPDVSGVGDDPWNGLPARYELRQNLPNPFNPATNIQFSIVNREWTTLEMFDVSGQSVATLVNEVREPGTYTVQFNGSNLASGVYFYRLTAGDKTPTKKMVLLK